MKIENGEILLTRHDLEFKYGISRTLITNLERQGYISVVKRIGKNATRLYSKSQVDEMLLKFGGN